MRRWLPLVAGCAVAVGAATAYAGLTADDDVIHACAGKVTGNLRLAERCTALERPVEWNKQGPPGPAAATLRLIAFDVADPDLGGQGSEFPSPIPLGELAPGVPVAAFSCAVDDNVANASFTATNNRPHQIAWQGQDHPPPTGFLAQPGERLGFLRAVLNAAGVDQNHTFGMLKLYLADAAIEVHAILEDQDAKAQGRCKGHLYVETHGDG